MTGRSDADRRGIALLMVLLVSASLMIIATIFAGSVTAEYRAAVWYRRSAEADAACLAGLCRAVAELGYDVWGVGEPRPFVSARYDPDAAGPESNLLPLGESAYYECGSGDLRPILRQRGFWNGEAWVVWAADRVQAPRGFINPWQMDPRPASRPERPGGAARYLSYGSSSGRVGCSSGSRVVRAGEGAEFDTRWPPGTEVTIDGGLYRIEGVLDSSTLLLESAYAGTSGAALAWCVPGEEGCPASADWPPTLPGGCQPLEDFLASGAGWAADPRWIDPARFIACRPGETGARRFGGVDLDGDGAVTARDKALRDWALWRLRCDAFLPEAMDNYDLFQEALHANNRRLWPNGEPEDNGWEFIDPRIVGDSFYLVFRSDPLYSLAPEVSGDPAWAAGGRLDARADLAGFRYPYDRSHLGRWAGTAWAGDACGGLVNTNQVNNDREWELFTTWPADGEGLGKLRRWGYRDAKWIGMYDALRPGLMPGRYAVTVLPDCGGWNAAALHGGSPHIADTPGGAGVIGGVDEARGFPAALRAGHDPQTGAAGAGALLSAHACSPAPVRPTLLPLYWLNLADGGSTYFCPAGKPDSSGKPGGDAPVDYTRAQEVIGESTGKTRPTRQCYTGRGLGPAVYNYLVWLGPYQGRAEMALHLRKAGFVMFNPPYPASPDHSGKKPEDRRSMEEREASAAALAAIDADARILSAAAGPHGYAYALDRFWDRELLVLESGYGSDGSNDGRFGTLQGPNSARITFSEAAAKPGQATRCRLLQEMLELQCFGGYRTPDGGWRLLDYLTDAARSGFRPEAAPSGTDPSPGWGGAGDPDDPRTWLVQRAAGSAEKLAALTASRLACMLRGENVRVAACPRGHFLANPRVDSWHRPRWSGGRRSRSVLRSGPGDATVDDIGEGCPVCGGRLFMSRISELYINEVGRFRERFRNAERPARPAFSMIAPAEVPRRGYVELKVHGYRGYTAGLEGSQDLVRFDAIALPALSGGVARLPAVLADPLTGSPYFTHRWEFDRRWRLRSTDPEAIDPEPLFRELGQLDAGEEDMADLRLLVWDDLDGGGRWHDVTHFCERGQAADSSGEAASLADPELYGGRWRQVSDDTAPDSSAWAALPLRCDDRYAAPDPDPAHRQAAAAGGFVAVVGVYRKMPVRWYGGDRPDPYSMEYDAIGIKPAPLGPWDAAAAQPPHRLDGRGVGLPETMRLSFAAHRDDAEFWRYRGDYDGILNRDGWPGPSRRDGVTRLSPPDEAGAADLNPRQYGLITFDGSFDGSRVALMRCSRAANRPDYGSWQLVDYVELSDAAGRPVRIGESCGMSDPLDAGRCLSWQARNPLDNRSNADGSICWDLLPMTLQNPDHSGALDRFAGYEPWSTEAAGAGCSWWGNGCAVPDRVTDPNPVPPGYADLVAGVCNCRNANAWTLDVPRTHADWGAPAGTDAGERASRAKLLQAHLDNCTRAHWTREADRKECMFSVPTGIGRSVLGTETPAVAAASASAPALPAAAPAAPGDGATQAARAEGRQRLVLPALQWTEGDAGRRGQRSWAAFSWDNWGELSDVTDLCSAFLWRIGDTDETADAVDGDGDAVVDGVREQSAAYRWSGGTVAAAQGRYPSEIRMLNRVNLNEVRCPEMISGVGWGAMSWTSLGRKPLKGFHAPSDAERRRPELSLDPGYNLRIRPWDLGADSSLDAAAGDPDDHAGFLTGSHCGTSPVHTVIVTGQSLDDAGEPVGEVRLRATIERTWDGRFNVLEFSWLTAGE